LSQFLSPNYAYLWGILLPTLVSLPMCLNKNPRTQRILGILSNTSITVATLVVFFNFSYAKRDSAVMIGDTDRISVALGVLVYAWTGIGSLLPIERTMQQHPKRFIKLVRVSICIAAVMHIVFGIGGYLSYGDSTCAVITLSLRKGSTKMAASTLLMISSVFIIPQQLFPFAEVYDRRFLGNKTQPPYWAFKENVMRIGMLAFCFGVAYFVPFYGLISSLGGAFGCCILGLLIPVALQYTWLIREGEWSLGNPKVWMCFGLFAFGFAVLLIGTVYALADIYKKLHAVRLAVHAVCY